MSNRNKWERKWMRVAASWLPFLFAGVCVTGMHAQSSGIAPLVSGDCSVTAGGVMSCSKTNGVAFAASATSDTTNAANITSGMLSTARTPALSGDVSKAAGSATTTVSAINGLALPTASGITATNTVGQIVAATAAQVRGLQCSGTPSANYYCDGNTGAWTAIPWTVNTNANLAQYSTVASAASSPALLYTGTLYTGGTGTTTTPHWYINQSGTAPSTWNVAGTHLGVNAASSFTGNFLDFHVNGGSSVFLVNYGGQVIGSNTVTFNSFIATGGTGGFRASLYTPATSSAACIAGTVAWDANYLYVCKATNTWMRSALSAF